MTVIYLLLNLVFVGFVPCEDVSGRPDVAVAAAASLLGDPGAQIKLGALPPPVIPAAGNDTTIPFYEAQGYTANLPQIQRMAPAAGFFENPTVERFFRY